MVLVPLAAIGVLAPQSVDDVDTQVIRGSVIELTLITHPDLMDNLGLCSPVEWIVGVRAQVPGPGTIDIAFEATGLPAPFMQIAIDECSQPWVAGQCTVGTRLLSAPATGFGPLAQSLSSMPADEQRRIRIVVQLAQDTPDSEQGQSAQLTVRATGFGDSVAISSQQHDSLPTTGPATLTPLLVGACGALTVGAVLAMRRRARSACVGG
jgi:hypothetical protein